MASTASAKLFLLLAIICMSLPTATALSSSYSTTITVTVTVSLCSSLISSVSSSLVLGQQTRSLQASSTSKLTFGQQSRPSSVASASASPLPSCAYWLADVRHQGRAAFNPNPASYQVFRNVKDFGAKGDGVSDDSVAIQNAITAGSRCGPGVCGSSTTSPAIVYFPPGTYVISRPIVPYYYTMLIGNANCLPVIKPSSSFSGGGWIIDANPYQPGGAQGWGSTNVFWRQIRNFVIDYSNFAPSADIAGIHWPTGQATSIQNIIFNMRQGSDSNHVGIFIENGSGGFIGDLTFNGGKFGLNVGNQQFTMRSLAFNNVQTAINQIWDWGWTYQGLSINNCGTGILMNNRNPDTNLQSVASLTLIDSSITNTQVGVSLTWGNTPGNASYVPGSSVIIENLQLTNVPVAVRDQTGTVLSGSYNSLNIPAWGQGHTYTPSGPSVLRGTFTPAYRDASTLRGDRYYFRPKPQYAEVAAANVLSIRTLGATGDGTTDDTTAIQNAIDLARLQNKVLFFDHGNYKVTRTVYVPAGLRIVGEAYPVIMSVGSFFDDINNPQPVVKVGNAGETGTVEWSDMIVSGQGSQAGAVFIEWNLISNAAAPSGMWDVHTRVGGFAGSNLQVPQCPKTPGTAITPSTVNRNCIAAFASMRITARAAYLLMENVWLWVADHDIEHPQLTQITIYAGRGLLIESTTGPIWLYGTSVEHHVLYEYNIQGASNIIAGQIQTETAYYQPNPAATVPFPLRSDWQDPYINSNPFTGALTRSGWGLAIGNAASSINIYGAGLYSFFSDYNVACSNEGNGQRCQDRMFLVQQQQAGARANSISVYNLNTLGTFNMVTQRRTTGSLPITDVARYSENRNGYVNTIAMYRPAAS